MKGESIRIYSNEIFLFKEIPYVIYKIENMIDGKYYIGSSSNYRNRWSHHLNLLRKNEHHCTHLQRAWNKFGEHCFKFNVILHLSNKNSIRVIEQDYLNIHFEFFKKYLYNTSQVVIGGGCGNIVGSKNPKSKLNEKIVKKIRKKFLEMKNIEIGLKYKILSNEFCVSELTISRIIRNKLWTHI